MKELEHLKELYLDEIKKVNKKGELTPADDEIIRKALERIEKINDICCCEEEDVGYSERSYTRRGMDRSYGNSYGGNYMLEGRYVSGRMPEMYSERRGRSATTGRYISRHDGTTVDHMINKLEDMKSDAPDRETMMAIDNVISKLERY